MGQVASACASNSIKYIINNNKPRDLIQYLKRTIGIDKITQKFTQVEQQISNKFNKKLKFQKKNIPIFDNIIRKLDQNKEHLLGSIKQKIPFIKGLDKLNIKDMQALKKIGLKNHQNDIKTFVSKTIDQQKDLFDVTKYFQGLKDIGINLI